tara:strand:+ start:764 stop:1252 length:489 start_codon:yes stop_codon:yes gene_type:complete
MSFLNATESEKKTDFEIHPKGEAQSVCVEVITHKKDGTPWTKEKNGDTKNRIILVFQTEKTREDGEGNKVNMVHWDWHNVPQSIANENSTLHKRLKEWGVEIKDYNSKEEFEAAVVGRPATLFFKHNTADLKTYSNIVSCEVPDKDVEPFVARDYNAYNDPF